MSGIIFLFCVLFAMAEPPGKDKLVIIYANGFAGEIVETRIDDNEIWSGKLLTKPEINCAAIVVRPITRKIIDFVVTINGNKYEFNGVNIADGRYIYFTYLPDTPKIVIHQSVAKPEDWVIDIE